MIRFTLLTVALIWALPAAAQHNHGSKGPNGGQMEELAGVHVELLTAGTKITLNVFNEDEKPLQTSGFTASALVTAGPDRETVTLTPQGDNTLAGNAKKSVQSDATVSITLKTAAGKTGQARFKK